MIDDNLVERIRLMYLHNDYEYAEGNDIFLVDSVEYRINDEYLKDLYVINNYVRKN